MRSHFCELGWSVVLSIPMVMIGIARSTEPHKKLYIRLVSNFIPSFLGSQGGPVQYHFLVTITCLSFRCNLLFLKMTCSAEEHP